MTLPLDYDLAEKVPAYARVGVPELWITNLVDQEIGVYRRPQFIVYTSKTVLHTGDHTAPQVFPDVAVDVTALLKG